MSPLCLPIYRVEFDEISYFLELVHLRIAWSAYIETICSMPQEKHRYNRGEKKKNSTTQIVFVSSRTQCAHSSTNLCNRETSNFSHNNHNIVDTAVFCFARNKKIALRLKLRNKNRFRFLFSFFIFGWTILKYARNLGKIREKIVEFVAQERGFHCLENRVLVYCARVCVSSVCVCVCVCVAWISIIISCEEFRMFSLVLLLCEGWKIVFI